MPPRRPGLDRKLRLFGMGALLLLALATVALVFPWIGAGGRGRLKRVWSRELIRVVGLRLVVQGRIERGALLIGNHVSWLDIFALNAVRPAAFVAKSEIRSWPVVGWLCDKADTIFIERGSVKHAQHVAHTMAERLQRGHSIAFFPEGTTSDGRDVLPFKAALLQPAVSTGMPVQPVAIRYRHADGALAIEPAYIGDLSFNDCLQATLACTGIVVEITALPPIATEDADRRSLAAQCETAIRAVLSGPSAG